MTSSKLSDSQKQEIVRLYQDVPEETTITLAEKFGVSSSTVRRILQSAVPRDVYDVLTHQKQRLRNQRKPQLKDSRSELNDGESQAFKSSDSKLDSDATNGVRLRKSSSVLEPEREAAETTQESNSVETIPGPLLKQPNLTTSNDEMGELITPELFSGEEFSDFDDEDDDDEDEDEDYGDNDQNLFDRPLTPDANSLVQILPLTEAELPKICYLVIDRASELIVKPLKAFAELGRIPSEEILEKTLPVFDNHRVASRFSARNQRVFKVPDGRLLQKTAPHLQAKGITRLLIDGQVYHF
ncbi:MAG: transcriptional regulator [Arthrospira sp. PLM2.Bin9]|nr:transcriptional regulator [Arthrospira sp. PLM2.Bin9]TVU55050.1 MAG: transcriptional regulator [Arthrospira sp. PLM2.Bin9]